MTQVPPPVPQDSSAGPAVPRPGELLDRFLARLIDGVIVGIAYAIFSGILNAVMSVGFSYSLGEWLIYYAILSIVFTAAALGYFGFMEASRGQTVGKMLLKLRTVGPDGVSNPTVEQAVRRNIFYAGYLVAIIPFVGWFLGPLAVLVAVILIAVGINNDTANRQAWHDHFAGGTRVLKIG